MCCLGWPFKDVEYEAAAKYKNTTTGFRYQWNGQSWDLQQIQVPTARLVYQSSKSSMASKSDLQDDLADSESSDSWQTVSGDLANSESSDSWQTVSPSRPAPAKMKSSLKPSKSRRVTVHTPSEQDLHERYADLVGRRPPTPYASSHLSTSDDDDRKASKPRKHDQPVTSPSTAAATAANTTANTAPPGIAPYNAPSGTVPQLGPNQLYTHGVPGRPSFHTNPATTTFATYPHSVNQPGQASPVFVGSGTTMDGYQNSFPNNAGLHFQPQVPDTSLGPMTHVYQPRFDNGCIAFHQPGIVGPHGVAVPVQAGPVTGPILPVVAQQPYPAQPMMLGGGPPFQGPPVMVAGGFGGGGGAVPPGQPVLVHGGPAPMGMGGMPMMPGNFPTHSSQFPVHREPATGIGQTAGEVSASFMMNPELNEPQDFKPADDNPSRMYMVRQLDGHYIQMPRATIDSFGKAARWYVTDEGVFYAVRLED